ncbi:MAG: two-component sensor histidine kinase [Deltaproteobacteria bacterium]|jgi:signal transduction histidine kinase|nr:two-component sensor histidine kinase [Deltaproteobacteria bacterium]MBW2532965.1 two-component sensor histidine kinase [Deltaproteobacteria bacterium]
MTDDTKQLDPSDESAPSEGESSGGQALFRYRRLWASIVIATCLVSLVPLVIMAVINYYQYQKAFAEEVRHPISLRASNARRSLQFYFDELLSTLNFVIHDRSYEELRDQKSLTRTFRNLRENHRGFVDIGVIDADGIQRAYVGPYQVLNKDYSEQQWFKDTALRGKSVSDVFMGHRGFPHLAVAVRNVTDDGHVYVLRATFNADILATVAGVEIDGSDRDSFIINHAGVLQTPSKTFGEILDEVPLEVPERAKETRIIERRDAQGHMRVIGYAYVHNAPYVYMVVQDRTKLFGSWLSLRNKLLLFLGVSTLVMVIVILAGASYMVNRIRSADNARLSVLHKVEYTAKMASIGRLAAGVAHEVNNPLAIINEKAGLLKDFLAASEDFKHKPKFDKAADSILQSVDRCARITRRLLRFAKHMDIRSEPINLENLLKEVLGFLEKESTYRNLKVALDVQEDVPVIESDRGRLQQVFLNIINNAFGAVDDGGRISIYIGREGDNHVHVTVRDNGVGIPREHLHHIFEPFFTTKEKHGTGLGLSITYGIVEKLGGKITVDSEVGEWTKFSVILPIRVGEADGKKGGKGKSDASAAG